MHLKSTVIIYIEDFHFRSDCFRSNTRFLPSDIYQQEAKSQTERDEESFAYKFRLKKKKVYGLVLYDCSKILHKLLRT